MGPVAVVAAFAGGGAARPGALAQTTEEEWHSSVDGSLTATFFTLESFLPGMIERGGGSVVTMASSAAASRRARPRPTRPPRRGW